MFVLLNARRGKHIYALDFTLHVPESNQLRMYYLPKSFALSVLLSAGDTQLCRHRRDDARCINAHRCF